MVIKDKALIQRMARDFKTGTGYTVARDNSMDGEPTLYMHGIGWAVQNPLGGGAGNNSGADSK